MQRLKIATLLFLSCFVALCLPDTALGQNTLLITDPNSMDKLIASTNTPAATLSYSAPIGGTVSQTFNASVSNSQSSGSVRFDVQPAAGTQQIPSWLRVNGQTGGFFNVAPTTSFSININAGGLAAGTYQAIFTMRLDAQTQGQAIIFTVNLNVGTSTTLTATPASMQFSAVQNSTTSTPASQNLTINTSTAPLTYNLQAQTTNGGNWLTLSATNSLTTGTSVVQVVANPTGLGTGTYNGTITATATSGAQVIVPVTLTVGTQSSITVTPANPPPFLFQVGGAAPANQTLSVSTASTSSISFTVSSDSFWLVPGSPSGPTVAGTPATVSVAVNISLQVGTYNGNVTISPFGGGNAVVVPFRLVVTTNPVLQVNPNSMTFSAPFAGQNPAPQTAQVTIGGSGTIGFTVASNAAWLNANASTTSVSPGNPATLTVNVTQGNLSTGTYNGTITITPTNGDNYTQAINVTLTVGGASSQLYAGPAALLFSVQTSRTGALGQQQVLLQTTGVNTTFTQPVVATTNCGTGWLQASASQSTTPATLTVSVSNSSTLPVGTCTGTITINPATGNPLVIPVTVAVSASALLVLNPDSGFGFAVAQVGGTPASQHISITTTDNSAATINVVADQPWLFVSGGATTPQNLTVFYQTAGLSSGVYSGNLTIYSNALPGGSFTIPMKLVLNPNVTVSVTPTQLTFTMGQGGSLPASQNITLSNSGSGNPTFVSSVDSVCANLIGVSPTSGPANGVVTVSVLTGAATATIGTYNCQITLSYQNAATQGATIAVTLNITSPRTINVPTAPLVFSYQLTQAQPASQKISLTSTGGAVQFNVATTSSGWLSTDTTTGNTPKDVQVSVSTAGLGAGSYVGQVTITAPGVLASAVTITVTLNITAAPIPLPTIILSTASNQAGNISPGALITIKGTLIGPPTPANGVLFTVNAQGRIDPILAGTRVLFSGIPGTPIFVSATQINVFVPYEIAGRFTADLVVEFQGVQSAPIQVRVNDVAPAIFTLNQQGFGQAAAVNQNGTFNGPVGGNTIPAAINTVLSVYSTGCGQTNPGSSTGSVAPTNILLRVQGTTTATIAGLPATVTFAGAAPGLAAGVCQLNVLVPTPPAGTSISGPQPITVTINGVSSPAGPTVGIQ